MSHGDTRPPFDVAAVNEYNSSPYPDGNNVAPKKGKSVCSRSLRAACRPHSPWRGALANGRTRPSRREMMSTGISAVYSEFADALTEILAENAVGPARRGRLARLTPPSRSMPTTATLDI